VHPMSITGLEISFDDQIQSNLIEWLCATEANMLTVKRLALR